MCDCPSLSGFSLLTNDPTQREELVELHLQGLPLNAIVRRTGHDHKTVQQWARRFAAEASLLDRARTGRPVTRVTRAWSLVFVVW